MKGPLCSQSERNKVEPKKNGGDPLDYYTSFPQVIGNLPVM